MVTIPDGMRRPAEAERDELRAELAEHEHDSFNMIKASCNQVKMLIT